MNGLGALFIWIVYVIVIVGSTIIVSILIANYFHLTGISWWACVIVVTLILNSLINGFKEN